jgi:hypothetical protein
MALRTGFFFNKALPWVMVRAKGMQSVAIGEA